MWKEEAGSEEIKLKIAQHFLLSSPPGQFNDVLNGRREKFFYHTLSYILTETRRLLTDHTLSDPLANGICRVHNLECSKIVRSPADNKVWPFDMNIKIVEMISQVALCSAGEYDPSHYVDPIAMKVFGIDHLSNVSSIQSTKILK